MSFSRPPLLSGKPPEATVTGQTDRDQFEGNFERNQARLSDQLLVDITISGAGQPPPTRERAQVALENADKKVKSKPDDLDARLARAMANFRLGENQKALDDFQVVTGKNPDAISANMTLPELFRWRQERSTVVFPAGFAPPELTADWL